MHSYLAGISKNLACPALIIDGTEDHVHLLTWHSKNITIVDDLRDLIRSSSQWIKIFNPKQKSFAWQKGTGVFSISAPHVDAVKKDIANQKDHHYRETFQDEFRRLCKNYHVEIDEPFVWD
jgi:putative transposase